MRQKITKNYETQGSPVALKLVKVEFVQVETVLVGDPCVCKTNSVYWQLMQIMTVSAN